MKSARFLQVVFAACFISTIAFGAAKPLPDTAKMLPPETMLLVNISDMNSLQKQFQNTNIYKIYKDPAMAAFFNGFKSKWQKNLRDSQDEMTKFIADVNTAPSGRLAAALILNEKSKQTGEPTFLLVSQWGKDVAVIKKAVDKAARKSLDSGARQEKETVRGHEIITITEKDDSATKTADFKQPTDESAEMKPKTHEFADDSEETVSGNVSKKDEGPESNVPAPSVEQPASPDAISYCFIGDALIAAEDKESLKFMISRIEGSTGRSLADDEGYQSTMRAVGPVHDIDIYVNIDRIIKVIAAQDSEGKMGGQLTSYGLDNVTSLGAAVNIGHTNGVPMIVKGLLEINGPKKGIMKIFEPQNAPLQVPRFVDASSVSLSVTNISIKNVYDELIKMMSTISPGFKASIEKPLVAGDENGKGRIELKKDILDYLGPQIITASSIKKPFSTGSEPAKTIIAVAITDRAAIEKSLATWHSSISQGKPDAKRELLGRTIYLLNMSSFMPLLTGGPRRPMDDAAEKPQAQPDMPKLAFTVTDTHLLLGTEENVAQAIRLLNNKDAGSLMSAPWFVRAKSALPGAVGIAGLNDGRTYGEYVWWSLKQKEKSSSGSPFDPTQMAISSFGEYFDLSLLPDFDAVKKYFGVSANYAVSRPDGFYFEFQQLDLKTEP